MSDILDLIDNAIEAWDVSGDAMRWTPEPVEQPWYAAEFERGEQRPYGHFTIVDETRLWGPDMIRQVEELGLALGFQMTEWQREVLRTTHPRLRQFRRRFLTESASTRPDSADHQPSTEQGTT
jgi:hypothetical protein